MKLYFIVGAPQEELLHEVPYHDFILAITNESKNIGMIYER